MIFSLLTNNSIKEHKLSLSTQTSFYFFILKVMNKLDGQFYAVKKILIRKVSKDDCMKVGHQCFINTAFIYPNPEI